MRGRFNEPIKRTSRGNRSFPWAVRKANEGWEVERTREKVRAKEMTRGKEIDGSRRSEEWRGNERGGEREGGKGSLRGSIGRFKDDHALSAAHHTTLRANQPPSDRWECYAVRKPPGNNP